MGVIENNGSDQAPVTFTIHAWGRKSMMIKGDLYDLCIHLRERFSAMSADEQRIPHCELFVGKAAKQRGDSTRMCHICGDTDHYKKRCPMRDSKHKKKGGRKGRGVARFNSFNSFKRDTKDSKVYCPEKARAKLTKIMARIQCQKEKKQQEIALLDAQQSQLAALMANVEVLDGQTVNEELKNIARSFKRNRKTFLNSRRLSKKGRSRRCKEEKKEMKMLMKQIRREEKGIRKEEKRAIKVERKRLKIEMKEKLNAARLTTLPLSNGDAQGSTLFIHVDGYNLIGCDSECRKGMRGRRGGMKRSRQRLARLLQENFMERVDALALGCTVRMILWFDGKGQNEKYGDIEIAFSSGDQIVDDRLVAMLGGMKGNFLVVTSDKKLTVRLHDIGVHVMKSGVFYKQYLAVKGVEKMDVDENAVSEDPAVGDEKEQNDDVDMVSEDFVHVIAGKVDCGQNDEECSPGGDSGDNDDETDGALEEMEGIVHEYSSPVNTAEGEDSDFMEIFGDEVEMEMSE